MVELSLTAFLSKCEFDTCYISCNMHELCTLCMKSRRFSNDFDFIDLTATSFFPFMHKESAARIVTNTSLGIKCLRLPDLP